MLELQHEGIEWDRILPVVEFGLRSAVNAETNLSAMDLWLCRGIWLPVDLTINTPSPNPDMPDAYIQSVRKRLELMYSVHAKQEIASREKMFLHCNKTARPQSYCVFDIVLLHDPVLHDDRTRKIAPQ